MPRLRELDPRRVLPSRADPQQRSLRKKIENEHPDYNWTPIILLSMLGIGLAFDVEHQVKKFEEKKERRERDDGRNERQSKRRTPSSRDSVDPRDSRSRDDKESKSDPYETPLDPREDYSPVPKDTRGGRSDRRRDKRVSWDASRDGSRRQAPASDDSKDESQYSRRSSRRDHS